MIGDDERVVTSMRGVCGSFPEGYGHLFQKVGWEHVIILVIFASSDPGLVEVAAAFQLPTDTLLFTSRGPDQKSINDFINNLGRVSKECLKCWGIPSR